MTPDSKIRDREEQLILENMGLVVSLARSFKPKNTFYIAEFISKLKGVSFETIAQQSSANTLKLFNNLRTKL